MEHFVDIAFLLVLVMAKEDVQTVNSRWALLKALEDAGHKLDEVVLHDVITEEMVVDNPRVTQNTGVKCKWNKSMAIQCPLASIPAYVIDWDVAIDWADMENLYGTRDRNLHLDYSTGAVSDRAFLLTMLQLKQTTDLADKGYWNRVTKMIHTVSVLLVYTAPNQKLVPLHNGLKALKSEKLWAECDREIAKGRDFGLSIFCKAPPTGMCRDFLPVLPEHDVVVFGATVEGDSLKVNNKAYSKTKALFARKLLAVKDPSRGKDSRMTLLPPWMTPLASPVISQFPRPKPEFWMQDGLLTVRPDGMFEPVKSMVDMNDAEFRTNTLKAFTGRPYKPAAAAGSGASTSTSPKGTDADKALPKDIAKQASPRPGSPNTVTSSTREGVPSETKKTATLHLP